MRATLGLAMMITASLAVPATGAPAQRVVGPAPAPANRPVYLDKEGVVRWSDDQREVALFGANYVPPPRTTAPPAM